MAKPNRTELRLLRYPPTRKTWICTQCGAFLNGSLGACWSCAVPKPIKPKLVWPIYERACKKAGIKPTGTPWTPPKESSSATDVRKRGIRRKATA
jgi:hypothetical protein